MAKAHYTPAVVRRQPRGSQRSEAPGVRTQKVTDDCERPAAAAPAAAHERSRQGRARARPSPGRPPSRSAAADGAAAHRALRLRRRRVSPAPRAADRLPRAGGPAVAARTARGPERPAADARESAAPGRALPRAPGDRRAARRAPDLRGRAAPLGHHDLSRSAGHGPGQSGAAVVGDRLPAASARGGHVPQRSAHRAGAGRSRSGRPPAARVQADAPHGRRAGAGVRGHHGARPGVDDLPHAVRRAELRPLGARPRHEVDPAVAPALPAGAPVEGPRRALGAEVSPAPVAHPARASGVSRRALRADASGPGPGARVDQQSGRDAPATGQRRRLADPGGGVLRLGAGEGL